MKILAFSDWRIQPLEMIINLVKTHKPDVILYAGDDLDRFIPLDKYLLLKTPRHLLKLNYPDFKPKLTKQNKLLTQKFKKHIQEIRFRSSDIVQKLGIPFYYVNGNDDSVLYTDNTYYTRIHNGRFLINGEHHIMTEILGKITFMEKKKFLSRFSNKSGLDLNDVIISKFGNLDEKHYRMLKRLNDVIISKFGASIYAPMNPSFGKFSIQKNDEKITIFGTECEFGLKSEIKNTPKEYADIYLSHLPPLGTLDLSVRFGMEHIGSKKLLDAIEKHHPRLAICGHSHMWGGITRKIGDTLIINVSSQDTDYCHGNYTLINTDDWSIEMKTEVSAMRRIRGMGTIESNLKRKRKNLNGRKSVENVAKDIDEVLIDIGQYKLCHLKTPEEFYDTIEKIENLGINTKIIQERIESLKWKEPKIIKKMTINPNKHAFVDVETGRAHGFEQGELWLIGLWYNGDLRQFLYPKEEKEFFNYLRQNRITSLVSWTRYDSNALRPVLERVNMNIKFIDACQRTSNCCIWHAYKLHEFYNALFDKKQKTEIIPGHLAGLYADHLIIPNIDCKYCPPKKDIIKQIMERNKEDILQMVEICSHLYKITNKGTARNVDNGKMTYMQLERAVAIYREKMMEKMKGKYREEEIDNMVCHYKESLKKRLKYRGKGGAVRRNHEVTQ